MADNPVHGKWSVETKPLTDEIVKALEIPNAAFVVVIDDKGTAVIFEPENTKEGTFPIETNCINSVYAACFYSYSGSRCVDKVDSTGKVRRVCRP